ncbi:diguanylate cyclase (GGDEF) domain-containing protein [Peptoclostridium litorale DSM 5388]|uniref:Diguanylate cyclase with GAF sensor n=1 Tax=Peptoclostridium litorale DSM 5388 TaxID=1121324 RepID=A0A069RHB5_PEPLI|nr:sensor domain-containing diguanylate cyclase [Peptoclostridium litorale]KDR96439.1 diguanylate cyclase with GAF sensor [Peptoclostridium litorale DSM 5388]SIN70573.1 diguanylate cyclase (GGDEF) domain-containing protein [Peptoclostridium litorale DSM 5388]
MGIQRIFKNTSEINDPYELKHIICELESQIFDLRYKMEEEHGMYWVLEQILQHTGELTTLEKLFESLTDILMGVFGVNSCKIYIETEDGMKCFERDILKGSIFHFEVKSGMDMVNIKRSMSVQKDEIAGFLDVLSGEDAGSLLITPLFNFKKNTQIGFIAMEHSVENYFTEKAVGFFNTVAIQISVVAENAILYEEIMDIAKKDTLTKCYNRKYYDETLKKLSSKIYSMAVYDLDNFKYVNDHYGHKKGDEVLVKIAQMALDAVKSYGGNVIRYGGDEFIIILHEGIEVMKKVMEFLRVEVEKHFNLVGLPITITSGVASYPFTTEEEKDLFFYADMALIEGKKIEKNKVYIAQK